MSDAMDTLADGCANFWKRKFCAKCVRKLSQEKNSEDGNCGDNVVHDLHSLNNQLFLPDFPAPHKNFLDKIQERCFNLGN